MAALFATRAARAQPGAFITLASTTSTEESGLFGHLLPLFRNASGLDVRVVAVGTGQALAIGSRGDADALLVHDRAGEDKFIADGFGIDRRDVMYNDFVLVGPHGDPARVAGGQDAVAALHADLRGPRAIRQPRRRLRDPPDGAALVEGGRHRAAPGWADLQGGRARAWARH